MAEDTEKKPAAPDEAPTGHTKKSRIVAISLVVVVVVGLVIQSVANMRTQDARKVKEETAEEHKEAPERVGAGGRLSDFAQQQRQAAGETAEARNTEDATQRQNGLLEHITGADNVPASPDEKAKQTAAEVADTYYLAERKRVLDAARAGMGGVSRGTSRPTGSAPDSSQSEIGRVDEQMAKLAAVPGQIEQRKQELLARAKANGIVLPPEIMARAGVSPGAAFGGSPSGIAVATNGSKSAPQASQDSSFGELASNRAARDPINAGPKPGEHILPTGSIISAITDMEMISDYVGNWWGVIARPVYDITLEHVLIPAGSKITGKSFRATGVNESIQNRMGSTPLWLIRPDGKRIDFRHTAGMDAAGVAALKGEVDRHFLAQFMGVGAYALIGLGPSMNSYGAEPNSSRDAFVKEATGKSRDIGRSYAEKYLNIVPTQTIPPGMPIKIFVEDDIYITAWESADEAHYKRR
ncbi:TrbI/VirB10 family protein [Janthinobacterium sp. MDT1-19]|uniref:TrbI/VirB10 family protein n=1 Tax=Janthinobacterium sp. MDT1-19 TaxID=1259339 RepID=UPI003F1F4966